MLAIAIHEGAIHRTAFGELSDILAYLAQHNRVAALEFLARLEELLARLGRFPRIGTPKYKPGIRMLPVGRYPFLVFYTVSAGEVTLLSIRHPARRRPNEGEEFE